MTGWDGRTLEPSDDHFLKRIPLVVRVHWRNLPRWGGVRADSARDHVHCMRPLRATTVARLGGSDGQCLEAVACCSPPQLGDICQYAGDGLVTADIEPVSANRGL